MFLCEFSLLFLCLLYHIFNPLVVDGKSQKFADPFGVCEKLWRQERGQDGSEAVGRAVNEVIVGARQLNWGEAGLQDGGKSGAVARK